MPVDGDWYNELGSKMSIMPLSGGAREFRGFYDSKVGDASGQYELLGRLGESEKATYGTPLGWTVVWSNGANDAFAATVWSGQYLQGEDEKILTTWLLTRSTDAGEAWEATVVGQDVFRRGEPAEEDVEGSARSSRAASRRTPR